MRSFATPWLSPAAGVLACRCRRTTCRTTPSSSRYTARRRDGRRVHRRRAHRWSGVVRGAWPSSYWRCPGSGCGRCYTAAIRGTHDRRSIVARRASLADRRSTQGHSVYARPRSRRGGTPARTCPRATKSTKSALARRATVGGRGRQVRRWSGLLTRGARQPKYEKLVMRDPNCFFLETTLPSGEPIAVQLGRFSFVGSLPPEPAERTDRERTPSGIVNRAAESSRSTASSDRAPRRAHSGRRAPSGRVCRDIECGGQLAA